jgi:hypothetical protein
LFREFQEFAAQEFLTKCAAAEQVSSSTQLQTNSFQPSAPLYELIGDDIIDYFPGRSRCQAAKA